MLTQLSNHATISAGPVLVQMSVLASVPDYINVFPNQVDRIGSLPCLTHTSPVFIRVAYRKYLRIEAIQTGTLVVFGNHMPL